MNTQMQTATQESQMGIASRALTKNHNQTVVTSRVLNQDPNQMGITSRALAKNHNQTVMAG